jgi:hypothetical protein
VFSRLKNDAEAGTMLVRLIFVVVRSLGHSWLDEYQSALIGEKYGSCASSWSGRCPTGDGITIRVFRRCYWLWYTPSCWGLDRSESASLARVNATFPIPDALAQLPGATNRAAILTASASLHLGTITSGQ